MTDKKKTHSQLDDTLMSELEDDVKMMESSKYEYPPYCGDCGIKRNKPPRGGTCPCCFSDMIRQKNFQDIAIYTCIRKDCKRVVSASYLSGFWSGWKESRRKV